MQYNFLMAHGPDLQTILLKQIHLCALVLYNSDHI